MMCRNYFELKEYSLKMGFELTELNLLIKKF